MSHFFFFSTIFGLLGSLGLWGVAHGTVHSPKSDRSFSKEVLQSFAYIEELRPQQLRQQQMPRLHLRDQFSLYSNSRFHLVQAHRICLDDPTGEMRVWMKRAEETHAAFAQALALSLLESLFGALMRRSGFLYSSTALGLYLDEEWILTEMLQRRLEILEAGTR